MYIQPGTKDKHHIENTARVTTPSDCFAGGGQATHHAIARTAAISRFISKPATLR